MNEINVELNHEAQRWSLLLLKAKELKISPDVVRSYLKMGHQAYMDSVSQAPQ